MVSWSPSPGCLCSTVGSRLWKYCNRSIAIHKHSCFGPYYLAPMIRNAAYPFASGTDGRGGLGLLDAIGMDQRPSGIVIIQAVLQQGHFLKDRVDQPKLGL